MNKYITVAIVSALLGAIIFWMWGRSSEHYSVPPADTNNATATSTTATSTPQTPVAKDVSVLGTSVGGREITAYHFGTGEKEVLFVGGVHGGYSWNTALLGFNLVDYLKKNPSAVPNGLKVTVIPVLNPDGLASVVGTSSVFTKADVNPNESVQVQGRFNGNNVDLNRNFDCAWQPTGTWQSKKVSGGTKPFSEPEAEAIRNYVANNTIASVVVWYSSAGGVFPAKCDGAASDETRTLTDTYSKASGYPAIPNYDYYEITGDLPNWLSKNDIPAISVLLATHDDPEWNKNLNGVKAVLSHIAK